MEAQNLNVRSEAPKKYNFNASAIKTSNIQLIEVENTINKDTMSKNSNPNFGKQIEVLPVRTLANGLCYKLEFSYPLSYQKSQELVLFMTSSNQSQDIDKPNKIPTVQCDIFQLK